MATKIFASEITFYPIRRDRIVSRLEVSPDQIEQGWKDPMVPGAAVALGVASEGEDLFVQTTLGDGIKIKTEIREFKL